MRIPITLLAVLATTTVTAQDLSGIVSQIPSCALTCIATAAAASHCSITDYACQCGAAKSKIQAAATPCVTKKCQPDEALKVLSLTNELCDAVGGSSSGASSAGPDGGGGAAPSPTPTKTDDAASANASFATSTDNGGVQPSLPAETSAGVGGGGDGGNGGGGGSGGEEEPTGGSTEVNPAPTQTGGAVSAVVGRGGGAGVVAGGVMMFVGLVL